MYTISSSVSTQSEPTPLPNVVLVGADVLRFTVAKYSDLLTAFCEADTNEPIAHLLS